MLYLMVFILPPLACLMAGRFWQSVLNALFCLTVVGMPIAVLHAWQVVKGQTERLSAAQTINVHDLTNGNRRRRQRR